MDIVNITLFFIFKRKRTRNEKLNDRYEVPNFLLILNKSIGFFLQIAPYTKIATFNFFIHNNARDLVPFSKNFENSHFYNFNAQFIF